MSLVCKGLATILSVAMQKLQHTMEAFKSFMLKMGLVSHSFWVQERLGHKSLVKGGACFDRFLCEHRADLLV